EVNEVSWSPDSKRIVSASVDKTVQVWDAADGGNVYTYGGHSDGVNTVAWSPDGKRIVSGGKDETVQAWDATDGGHVYTYPGHTSYSVLNEVKEVPKGHDSISISDSTDKETVQVWNAADGGNVYIYGGHSQRVYAVAWSPDG